MSRYVITIAPDTADAATAQTTVRVDTSSGQARITEVSVRAADGSSLAPSDLPAVDLGLLIRALAAPATVAALPAGAREAEEISGPVLTADTVAHREQFAAEPAGAAEPEAGVATPETAPAAPETSEVEPAPAPAKKASRRSAATKSTAGKAAPRSAAAKATAAKSAKAAPAKAGAVKSTVAKASKAAKATKTTATKATKASKATKAVKATKTTATKATAAAKAAPARAGEVRAYRRMPDAAEVLAAYAKAGSITGLAKHYGVPRHTANGWARRLRSQGHPIGRN